MESALAHGDTESTREPRSPRIGILVVAYNAATTLAGVLDRVPKDFRARISNVFVCDDASQDATYLVGLGYQQITQDLPLTIIRHPSNLGYQVIAKAVELTLGLPGNAPLPAIPGMVPASGWTIPVPGASFRRQFDAAWAG